MKWFITWGKKLLIGVIIFIISFSFIFGFLMGDKYGKCIPVLNKRIVPIYKVAREDEKISITLDGTWGAKYTEDLLKLFDKYNIKVTFFFAGYWLEKYPNLVKQIVANGHEIGNHTFTHPHCNRLTEQEIKKELDDTASLINKLTGKNPNLFRPPFGEYNNKVVKIARDNGYQVVQWSLDSLDWQGHSAEYIVNRIEGNVSAGEIILMHNNAPHTLQALKILIPKLQKKDFEIVPLSKLIYNENYLIYSHNGLQIRQGDNND